MPVNAKTKPRVLVAMSGGVDSSVAAALLKEQGYDVLGCFMRLGSEEGIEPPDASPLPLAQENESCASDGCGSGGCSSGKQASAKHQGCCSVGDAIDARTVAGMVDVPFYVLNFKRDFGRIIDYFVAEYNAGKTPNPCVRCNDWLKFGKLHDYAASLDCDYVATGHYARIVRDGQGNSQLVRGVDTDKDQSYVLFGTPRKQLEHTLLPIGELEKAQVRRLAALYGLPVFDKPDSQEICFVPDRDYAGLVKRQTPDEVTPGPILDRKGNVVGEHPGHQHFTIGQRRGVGVALGHPIYVVEKSAKDNSITVADRDALACDGCEADQCNWLDTPPTDWTPMCVQVRYNSKATSGQVTMDGQTMRVRFDEPVDAVSPGQAVVCYDGNRVLGGGWITKASRCG